MKRYFAFVMLLVQTAAGAGATTYYVAADGSGDLPTIQAAVGAASPGDVIELGEGTFLGGGNRDVDCMSKELTIRSQSGNPALCIIDCQGSWETPHRGFLLGSSAAPEPHLEGVTIRSGDVRTDDTHLGGGGAVYCGQGSPRIENCILEGNLAQRGGGIDMYYAVSPLVRGCVFSDNEANDHGGGLFGGGDSTGIPTLENCEFLNNSAYHGGGVYTRFTAMAGCSFVGNTATMRGGGALHGDVDVVGCIFEANQAYNGGAVSIQGPSTNNSYSDCSFLDNNASEFGGALHCEGWDAPIHVAFTDCRFEWNEANYGGVALLRYGIHPTFARCWFGNNEATGAGVAYVHDALPDFTECTFYENTADWGGAFLIGQADPSWTNCTFYANAGAFEGGSLWISEWADCSFQNTILAFSTAGPAIYLEDGGELSMSCCDLYGNAGGDWTDDIVHLYGTGGNISLDPQFCDAPGGNLELSETSPCAPFSEPNPECDLIGAYPVGCGPTPTPVQSWGRIKTLFRE